MGELHLDVLVDRMVREFKVAANVGKPQVSYRETIRRAAEGNGRFVRQTGGKGQYGHAVITLEPLREGRRLRVRRQDRRRHDPARVHQAGRRRASARRSQTGIFAGYPMVDVKVTLFDGSFHEVDSSEMAFKIAGSMAVKDAFDKADPAILEPIMKVEVVMPEEFMGDVIGDLNSRRGHIEGMESARQARQVVRAFVPLAAMFGYATDLRQHDPGSRDVLDGVLPLRRSAASRSPASWSQKSANHAARKPLAEESRDTTMAKKKFERTKPHVNIGTIGHIDHGKTTPDGGHHQVPGPEGRGRVPRLRLHRQRARGARARHHHRHRPRRVRDRRAPLRPRRLPRATPTTSRT